MPVAKRPELRPFQREGVDFLRAHGWRALVADSMGLGKTVQVLAAINEARDQLLPALIVAPASVVHNWRREARVWVPGVECAVVEDERGDIPRSPLVVVSWDLLNRRQDALDGRAWRSFIVDEAHYAKNPEAQRSRAAQHFAAQARRGVMLLTGTPLVNNEEDLATLQRLLGTRNPPMLRRLFEQVVTDVPPKTRVYLPVTLPPAIKKEYAEAEEDFGQYLTAFLRAQLGAGTSPELAEEAAAQVDTAMSAEALQRVGYLRRILGRGKAGAAAEWAASMVMRGEPVVMFAEHADVLDIIEKRLKARRIRCSRLDGSTPKRERQEIIDRFQTGLTPVFLCSRAGAEGITLTRACHLAFCERFWTPALEEQAEDRIRRIGQARACTIWYLHVEGTFDDRVREIVDDKRQIVAATIGATKIAQADPEAPPPVARNLRLPNARSVAAVLFRAPWRPKAAAAWLRMQGYTPGKCSAGSGYFRIEVRDLALFAPRMFKGKRLAESVTVVLGVPRRSRRVRNPNGAAGPHVPKDPKPKARRPRRRKPAAPVRVHIDWGG